MNVPFKKKRRQGKGSKTTPLQLVGWRRKNAVITETTRTTGGETTWKNKSLVKERETEIKRKFRSV